MRLQRGLRALLRPFGDGALRDLRRPHDRRLFGPLLRQRVHPLKAGSTLVAGARLVLCAVALTVGCGRTPLLPLEGGATVDGGAHVDAATLRDRGGPFDLAQDHLAPSARDVASPRDLASPVDLPVEARLSPDVAPMLDARPPADIAPAAGALHPDTRLLAVSRRDIYELDRGGRVLQQRSIPDAASTVFFDVSGAAMTGRQSIHLGVSFLAGTSTVAGILTLDLASGRHDVVTAGGYRTAGLQGAFGIATAGGFVFAGNFDDAPGLFRFDLAGGVHQALPGPEENRYTVDVTSGRDGLIYLLTSGLLLAGYDPRTLVMATPRRIDYPPSGIPIRGVAVDTDGTIFAAAEQGQLLRFSATGSLAQTVKVPGVYWFHDVDIDGDGRLLFGGDHGELVVTDRAFSAPQLIQLPTTDKVEIVVVE
jgi:hypothetical protein